MCFRIIMIWTFRNWLHHLTVVGFYMHVELCPFLPVLLLVSCHSLLFGFNCFFKSQVHGDISDSSLSRTLLKEDPSNENVVGSWATPSLSRSAGSPTMKYGVAPDTTTTTQQQETGRIPKNTHSIFSTLVRWIPGSNSFSKGRNLTEDSDVNDDVTRGLQSPYHTVESYHLQSTPELSTYEESSTSDILSLTSQRHATAIRDLAQIRPSQSQPKMDLILLPSIPRQPLQARCPHPRNESHQLHMLLDSLEFMPLLDHYFLR